jgi:hypothetical protein
MVCINSSLVRSMAAENPGALYAALSALITSRKMQKN